ncbi:hypothetical protein [Aphanothece sacrum]|uniref:Membrane protein n=1 Tax=Aphanothece sacrum FPU1 TaxID=1920663 RepID=A0A401IM06_APHSA|nr:hypothetical protein [Aphanothece sacrum]GBF82284.1 membrane protein [Aphanothece sacrum FPU1]GBF84185.1 membrane protein [Aphanothece sacrum FPU3]
MKLINLLKQSNRLLYIHQTNLLILILYGVIAIGLMAPMASDNILSTTGDNPSHLGYMIQAKMGLDEGQFPLRIAPVENNSWRYPSFQFYSQIPYTLGGLFYKFFTPNNPYEAYRLVIWLSLLMGSFYIYRLSYWLINSQIASILSGISYLSSPYFLNNIHARGAFTEAVAQGILPIIIYYVIQSYNYPKIKYIFLCSIAWFALATTHIITFVYSTLFIGLFGLILIIKTGKINFKLLSLCRVIIGYGVSWLLSLYFLVPVIFESSSLSIRQQVQVISPFENRWYSPLANLLSPTSLPPFPSEMGVAPTYGLHPSIGWIFLSAVGVIIYYNYFARSLSLKSQSTYPYLITLLWIFLIAFLAIWSPIDFWKFLPRQLWVTQFSFRILTHIMWTGALLTGYGIILIFRKKLDRRHLILGLLIIIIASRSWLPSPRGNISVDDIVKDPRFKYTGALDYLNRNPIEALYGNAELPLLPPKWIPDYSTWDIFVNQWLVLPIKQNYPVWKAEEKPVLSLEGEVLDNLPENASLVVQLNGKIIDSISLSSSQFTWNISFYNINIPDKYFRLKFLVNGTNNNEQTIKIKINKFVFQSLSPQKTIIPVSETEKNCSQEGVNKVCQITITPEAQIIQLPVLYYPKMLKIWVNNQRVNYFPVYYRDYNLVGLQLEPGTYKIKVAFHGLSWANWISGLAWLGLISGIIVSITQDKKTIKSTSRERLKFDTIGTKPPKGG